MKHLLNFYKKSNLNQKIIYLFILIICLFFFALIINLIIDCSDTLLRISVHYKEYFASDFHDIYRASKYPTPYDDYRSIYPPLAHFIMKCIGLIFSNWVAYAIFHIGVLILVFVFLYKLMNQKLVVRLLLIFCIIVSWPFLFEVERGNLIIWAFCLLFCFYIIISLGIKRKDAEYKIMGSIGLYTSVVYLFIGCFASLFIKEKYKLLALYTILMILVPQMSFMYCLILLPPSLISFLNYEKKTKKDIIIFICYIILFLSFPFPCPIRYTVVDYELWALNLINTPLQIIALLTISFIYIINGFINMVKLIKQKQFCKRILNLTTFKRDNNDLDFSNGIMGTEKYDNNNLELSSIRG